MHEAAHAARLSAFTAIGKLYAQSHAEQGPVGARTYLASSGAPRRTQRPGAFPHHAAGHVRRCRCFQDPSAQHDALAEPDGAYIVWDWNVRRGCDFCPSIRLVSGYATDERSRQSLPRLLKRR